MDFPYYESTKILKRQIKKSFKKIITNSTLNNHLYTIKKRALPGEPHEKRCRFW